MRASIPKQDPDVGARHFHNNKHNVLLSSQAKAISTESAVCHYAESTIHIDDD